MGSGEAGLARALAWGKRTVSARVYRDTTTKVTFDTDILARASLARSVAKSTEAIAGSQTVLGVKISPPKPDELEQKLAYFQSQRTKLEKYFSKIDRPKLGYTAPEVRTLQETLRQIGYLDQRSTGIYGPATKAAIAQFQIDKNLVLHETDPNAGVLGSMTRSTLIEQILYEGVEIPSIS